MILPLASAAIGIALDGWAVHQMLATPDDASGLLLHTAAVVVSLPGMMAALPTALRKSRAFALVLCLGFAATAPVLGMLSLLYLGMCLRRTVPPRDDDLPYLTGSQLEDTRPAPILSGESLDKSIVDLLHGQDTAARRNAILALKEVEPKLAIPILRKGIQDSDEQVRIYSQNNLAKILGRQEQSIKLAKTNLSGTPQEPATMIRLAEEYHELVYLGLADDQVSRISYLEKAIALLDTALQKESQNQAAWLLLMRCCIATKDLPKAELCATKLRESGMQEEILLPWVLELQFADRKWSDLRSSFERFREARYSNPAIESLAEFWIGRPSSHA